MISGRYDIFNPPADGQELAALLPRARLEVFEDAGHLLTWEQPGRYVTAVREFLLG